MGGEFPSLGPNSAGEGPAAHLGFPQPRAVTSPGDSRGPRLNYEVVGQAVAAVRCNAPLDEHWKDAIEEDFRRRQKRRWQEFLCAGCGILESKDTAWKEAFQ